MPETWPVFGSWLTPLFALNHSFSASLSRAAVSFGSFFSCALRRADLAVELTARRCAASAAEEVGDAADPARSDAEEHEADQKRGREQRVDDLHDPPALAPKVEEHRGSLAGGTRRGLGLGPTAALFLAAGALRGRAD